MSGAVPGVPKPPPDVDLEVFQNGDEPVPDPPKEIAISA
jgi:hypothetical protein